MVYTDETFLLADSVPELHLTAHRLRLSNSLFSDYPLPHYVLDVDEQQRAFQNAASLDVETLKAGSYFIRVVSPNKQLSACFLKD